MNKDKPFITEGQSTAKNHVTKKSCFTQLCMLIHVYIHLRGCLCVCLCVCISPFYKGRNRLKEVSLLQWKQDTNPILFIAKTVPLTT